MRLLDLLSYNSISIGFEAEDKTSLLGYMADLLDKGDALNNKTSYLEQVLEREREMSTGIGGGFAIPHGRCSGVTKPAIAAVTLAEPIDYQALDRQPVSLLFMIAAPEEGGELHLDILGKLAMMLMDADFVEKLKKAATPFDFMRAVDDAEKAWDAKKAELEAAQNASNIRRETVLDLTDQSTPIILAVTGCPTGIAHTYMAAEALERAAKAVGVRIKVETQGASGVFNELTEAEIKAATGIIVAADRHVPMSRFDGKPLLSCPVSRGIRESEDLIVKILNRDVPRYWHKEAKDGMDKNSKENRGRMIYRHLMSGVSHMIPFVVGGGILIAMAFLWDQMIYDIETLSLIERQNFGSLTSVSRFLRNDLGGVAFSFMLPILAGYIAKSIADRPGLAVGIVGGAIAGKGHSGFLGALLAGFLAGYLMRFLRRFLDKLLPKQLEGIKSVLLLPLTGIIIVGTLMLLVIEPTVGALNVWLNYSLHTLSNVNKIILGCVLGGMMATDMGGPFNKTAYLFGTAAITAQNYDIMAAVMLGGMVPPCAVALATLLFRNRFTELERKSASATILMGLSFVTEGAIPYASADPLHVLPAIVLGSALAGGMSMGFHCGLMAPHGGIFVFPLVEHPLWYIVCLAAGTLWGAILLGILKKRVEF